MKPILSTCAFVTLVVCVSARPQVNVRYTEPATTYTDPATTYTGPISTLTKIYPSTELHSNSQIIYGDQKYYYPDVGNLLPGISLDDSSVKVMKHVYVHVAPEEPEEPRQGPKIVNVGRPQKHYKIIFIKAPTQSPVAPIVPIQPPNEEKTLVYVLVKKPEINEEIILPPVPNVQPSKPEVYFIKYKNKDGLKPIGVSDTEEVSLQNANFVKTSQVPQIVPLTETYGQKK